MELKDLQGQTIEELIDGNGKLIIKTNEGLYNIRSNTFPNGDPDDFTVGKGEGW